MPSTEFFISADHAGSVTGSARARPAVPVPDEEFTAAVNDWLQAADLIIRDFAERGKAGCHIPSAFSKADGRMEAHIRDFLTARGFSVEVRVWVAGPHDHRLDFWVSWKPENICG